MTTRAQAFVVHALIGATAAVGVAWWVDRRAQRRHLDATIDARQERAEWLGVLDEVALSGDALRRTMSELSKNVGGVVDLWAKVDSTRRAENEK